MKIKKSFPVAIICGGIFLIFLFVQFIFIPIQSKILEMQTETKRLQAIEKNLSELQSRHENFSEFVELTAENLSVLKKFLPEKSAQENFTAELYKFAEKNKLAVIFLQVGELVSVENAEKNFQMQSIKIKLEGNYISLLNFLREVEDGERFAKLENISLENSAENFVTCNAEFFIYSYQP